MKLFVACLLVSVQIVAMKDTDPELGEAFSADAQNHLKIAAILRSASGLERKTGLEATARGLACLAKEQPQKYTELLAIASRYSSVTRVIRGDVKAPEVTDEEKSSIADNLLNALSLSNEEQAAALQKADTTLTALGVSSETKKKILIVLGIALPVVSTVATVLATLYAKTAA